jgi:hypothetical protein
MRPFLFFSALLVLCQCAQRTTTTPSPALKTVVDANPAADGFNATESDAQAVRLADEVMLAQGGRTAWDATHFISWNFFGSRRLLWDKYTGQVRVEWLKKPQKVVVNINTGKGRVWLGSVEQSHPDSLSKYLQQGKEAWINDAYWLVMPFKLKDSGVTLKHLGASKTDDGRDADLLQLTFANVGVTPDNKYHVWVDRERHLVTQWAYFKKYTDEKPGFVNPWTDYRTYGRILLSGGRGRGTLTEIEVLDSVPAGAFE